MLWEAVAFAVLGFAVSYAATRLLPARLPATPLVLATGPAAALGGGLVAHTIFGAGRPEMTFPGAVIVAVALLSLLARPERRSPLT